MANESIKQAFERMWQHITNALNQKADKNEATTTVTDDGEGNVVLTNVAIEEGEVSETDPTVPTWAKQANPPIESDPTVPSWAKNPNPPAETDPTVPDWAKQPNKPTYKWDEITEKPEKLGGDAVEYVEQTLTEGQKSQARENIGAAPAYTASTTDLTAGTSPLASGKLYFVYE